MRYKVTDCQGAHCVVEADAFTTHGDHVEFHTMASGGMRQPIAWFSQPISVIPDE